MPEPPTTTLRCMRNALRRESSIIAIVASYLTVGALIWAYETKASCAGTRLLPCYSDLRALWRHRGLDEHLFPYIHGGITEQGTLYGGVVEYPTLSGVFIWASGLGADSAPEFLLHSAVLLAPFAIGITLLLAWLTRWYVLLWVITPPLVMYAYLNWELPVVFTAVAAVAVMAWGSSVRPGTGNRRMSLRTSAVLASILLAFGFAFKIYPGLFVLPLALYVLTRGAAPQPSPVTRPSPTSQPSLAVRRPLDIAGACYVVVAAILTVAATQVPFMVAGYDGWRAALEFQSNRRASIDTNTFWYWGVRQLTGTSYDDVVAAASPLLVLAAAVVAMLLGIRVYRRTGTYPWIGVSAAVLAGFMLFHKVHSPQYMLWLLPFFVLMRVRWSIVVTYLVADVLLNLTVFRMLNYVAEEPNWAIPVIVAVYVQLILLAILLVTFPGTALREPLASYVAGRTPAPGPLTRAGICDSPPAKTAD